MPLWPIILGVTLAGGLLLLHGFAKAKQTSEYMLDTYDRILQDSRQRREIERAAEEARIKSNQAAGEAPPPGA